MHLSVDSSEEAFVFLTVANMHIVAFFLRGEGCVVALQGASRLEEKDKDRL